MTRLPVVRPLVAALALGLSIAPLASRAAAALQYRILDLGAGVVPSGANDSGTVVGNAVGSETPMIYTPASFAWSVLPTQSGTGEAHGINANGVAVGRDGDHSAIWKNGTVKKPKGTKSGGAAWSIASDGTIAGYDYGGSYYECWRWKAGTRTTVVGTDAFCQAYAIDPTATYVGGDSGGEAFLNMNGSPYGLGTLAPLATSRVHAVNKFGHAAVGSGYDATDIEGAAYWNGSQLVSIGLHGRGGSRAPAINASDDVLVGGDDGMGHHLFLWNPRSRVGAVAIEPRITNTTGWDFAVGPATVARWLTDGGVIYGAANYGGVLHAFKLVPVAAE